MQFQGFKPDSLKRIAGTLGYQGDMNGFDQYLNSNPDKKKVMDGYFNKAMQMAKGGVVKKFAVGGYPSTTMIQEQGQSSGQTLADSMGMTYGFDENRSGPAVMSGSGGQNDFFALAAPRPQEALYGGPLIRNMGPDAYPEGTAIYQEGAAIYQDSPRALQQQYIPQQQDMSGLMLTDVSATQAINPGLPTGSTVVPVGTQLTQDQFVSPTSGQVTGQVAVPTAMAGTAMAGMQQPTPAATTQAATSQQAVQQVTDQTQAQQGQVSQQAQVQAQTENQSMVSGMQAAQGAGIMMTNPVQRQIQSGELVSGSANAQTAAQFTEQVQAATATPTKQAMVQGQLDSLMQDFAGGATPTWAAGAMRNAAAQMAARGLGASSVAGQAIIQAAMESALPIAQADAATLAQFEQQNLSNKQQRAMLAAQQRATFLGQEFDQEFQARVANAAKVSDVANMNFTAEQQIALENSRIANTMNLENLSNRQAVVMGEVAALAQLDMANLNNRQQAAVQNAQSFLNMDMTNLTNAQQTELFKAQERIQSLFTDQAAENATRQFNATSENQVTQFFSNLASQTSQFNASQANAQAQFNAGQINTVERFNAEINNQRDQFNAQNRLVVDQANAQWRREVATADTSAVNRANELNASALLDISNTAYNNLWQYYSDSMEWAWTSAENERERTVNLAIEQLRADSNANIEEMRNDYQSSAAFGGLIATVLTSDIAKKFVFG